MYQRNNFESVLNITDRNHFWCVNPQSCCCGTDSDLAKKPDPDSVTTYLEKEHNNKIILKNRFIYYFYWTIFKEIRLRVRSA